jgi:hypothetical protein
MAVFLMLTHNGVISDELNVLKPAFSEVSIFSAMKKREIR